MSDVISMDAKQGLLSAEEILAADDLRHTDVPVPEWTPGYIEGGDVEPRAVRLRVLQADEAIDFATSLQGADAGVKNELVISLIAVCAIDENGDRLFAEDQVAGLRKKSFSVYQRLQNAVLILNGFADEEKAIEAEKKDSGEIQGSDSPTD
jgi:hypothetical protein